MSIPCFPRLDRRSRGARFGQAPAAPVRPTVESANRLPARRVSAVSVPAVSVLDLPAGVPVGGIAVADGRVYVSCVDGAVRCYQ